MGPSPRRWQRHAGSFAAQREAVERVEAYQRAHLHAPVRLSRLCPMVGLSERGLRNAFYTVRGMSPQRSLRASRLQWVREALNDTRRPPGTVTAVATSYGFFELGRFAAVYKEAFGEAPSETLRRGHRTSDPGSLNTQGNPLWL
jgi:transcriptional regulator GlxA family with amidase domain